MKLSQDGGHDDPDQTSQSSHDRATAYTSPRRRSEAQEGCPRGHPQCTEPKHPAATVSTDKPISKYAGGKYSRGERTGMLTNRAVAKM
jgi:hypothetical protein